MLNSRRVLQQRRSKYYVCLPHHTKRQACQQHQVGFMLLKLDEHAASMPFRDWSLLRLPACVIDCLSGAHHEESWLFVFAWWLFPGPIIRRTLASSDVPACCTSPNSRMLVLPRIRRPLRSEGCVLAGRFGRH